MRLLQLRDGGEFSLVEYIGKEIPQYAILSHTWGVDHEEVSFRDLMNGTGKSKAGYQKLVFCAKQAARDGLQFFWVDTCSIDKSSSAELSEAINSMFQWYSGAYKCYVYLSDVSSHDEAQGAEPSHQTWKSYFRSSRWFTRGWTLQELIAPKTVEFFSTEGQILGTKLSLMEEICNITGLSAQVLNGNPLSHFSVSDRISWANKRETKREEDAAYSLLGIFDIHMPLLYGEGRKKAFARLYREIESSHLKTLPSSTVPFRRDDDFISRDSLDKIRQICARPASRAALVGLGGVGKSQIAIEHAYWVRDASPTTWVFWVHAGTRARFEEGYRRIAEATKIDGWDNPKADILRLVRSWLCDESNGRWLIVLDNADDSSIFFQNTANPDQPAELLSDFLPQSPNGSLVITSRSQATAYKLIGTYDDIVEVKPMDKKSALALLKKKLKDITDEDDAFKLIYALDAMPLAITQAAAFIRQRAPRMTVQRYVDEVCKSDYSRARLLNKDVGDTRRDGQASNSILATWQISFEHIRTYAPKSAHLLSLMSLFDRQGIPESLLREQYEGDVARDSFDDDIHMLISYSLVEMSADADQFEMHRLVQFSTKKWLEVQGDMEIWKEKYITLIDNSYPVAEYENWKVCQMLLPHAQTAIACRPAHDDALKAWASILCKVACYADDMGHYQTAQELNQSALEVRKALLGPEHPATIFSISNLATTFWNQGKWKEAEELELQVIESKRTVLGEEHPETLRGMNNLALTYWNQGKWRKAEELNDQVMKARKRVLGEEHPETLISISSLVLAQLSQGRWNEAEKLSVRVIETKIKVLGEEHPDTLSSLSSLALIYWSQGRWNEAERLSLQLRETKSKVLGEEHPDTLTSIYSLASIYRSQGRWKEAERLCVQVIEARKKVLGPEHPVTLRNINGLASTLRRLGRWKEAERLEVQVIEALKRVLPPEHPDTLDSMHNLALTYKDQGRLKESEELEIHVIEIRKRVLGQEHPGTLDSIANLALIYWSQGRWNEAEKLSVQVIETRIKALGEEHPDTLASKSVLVLTYWNQGRWKEAEELGLQIMDTSKRTLGDQHPNTLTSMANLALVYKSQSRHDEAILLMEKCLQLRNKILGPRHPKTAASLKTLKEWQV